MCFIGYVPQFNKKGEKKFLHIQFTFISIFDLIVLVNLNLILNVYILV